MKFSTVSGITFLIGVVIGKDFYVGYFEKNDFLVAQDTLNKARIPYKLQFAKYGRLFKCPITYIRVVDRLGYGRGPRVQMIRGGLQKKYVVMRLSAYNSPISVNIYVGCRNKNKPTTRPPSPMDEVTVTVDGKSIALIPGDNSGFGKVQTRLFWMENDDDELVLVDLEKEPTKEELLQAVNGGSRNQYWLYTRKNPHDKQILIHGDEKSIRESYYQSTLPTNVITHGFLSKGSSTVATSLTEAFLFNMECNVIVLDWSYFTIFRTYNTAGKSVPSVGKYLGEFLEWLIKTTKGDWNKFHLVGHSLGAHVMGFAGRQAKGRPRRITGMDPAGPGWGKDKKWPFNFNEVAISATDGQYVECIHTHGNLWGILEPNCRANFYPNGGVSAQPGCKFYQVACSHQRAHQLMASSIRTDHFVGRRCKDLDEAKEIKCGGDQLNMGNAVLDKKGEGIFGLVTKSSWPYKGLIKVNQTFYKLN